MEIIKNRFKNFKEYEEFYEKQPVYKTKDEEVFHGADKESILHAIKFENNTHTLKRMLFINEVVGESGNILDVGCSCGIIALPYAYKGRRVVGIDINSEAINHCKIMAENHKIKDCEFYCSSFEEFKTDEKFAFVILSEIIEHVLDPIRLLEFAEQCCLNKVLITTPDYYGPFGFNNPGDTGKEHIRAYKSREIEDLISQRGEITDRKIGDILMFAYKPWSIITETKG